MIWEVAAGVIIGVIALRILTKWYRAWEERRAFKQANDIISMIANRPEMQELAKKYGVTNQEK